MYYNIVLYYSIAYHTVSAPTGAAKIADELCLNIALNTYVCAAMKGRTVASH